MASSRYRSRSTVESWLLSNLDKVLYPGAGFHKAEVIDYYRRIAPVMLAHLAGRPPTLVRAPDGPDGERFFEKRCPPHHPDWVPTEAVVRRRWTAGLCRRGGRRRWCGSPTSPRSSCTPTSGRSPIPWHPTAVVLDLDPGPPAGVARLRPGRARAPRDPRPVRSARGREDVGRQGAPPLGAAQHRHAPTHEDTKRVRARARAAARDAATRSASRSTWPRSKRPDARVRRLEPERQPQDDRVRVLAAHPRAADGVDAGVVGRDRRRRRRRRRAAR